MTQTQSLMAQRGGAVPTRWPLAFSPSVGPYTAVNALLAAFDHLTIGMILSSDTGVVLHANGTAARLMATADGIQADTGQRLRIGTRMLAEIIHRARISASPMHFAVKRPSGQRPLTVSVVLVDRSPSALVYIFDPMRRQANIPEGLYDLTGKERAIAVHLAQGKSIDEAAAEEKIARSTARTHLRHIFDKVGVTRQSELVAVLASGALFGGR